MNQTNEMLIKMMECMMGDVDKPQKVLKEMTWRESRLMNMKHNAFAIYKAVASNTPFYKVIQDHIEGEIIPPGLDHAIDFYLYEKYMDDMPYGTAKARDGDPGEWIAYEHEWMDSDDYRDMYGDDWPSVQWSLI